MADGGAANFFALSYNALSQTWGTEQRLNDDVARSSRDASAYFDRDGALRLAYLATDIRRTTRTVLIDGVQQVVTTVPEDGQTDLNVLKFAGLSSAPTAVVGFSQADYEFSEGAGHATLVITRTGDTSGAVTVAYQTIDDPAAVPCAAATGVAYARCDYATTVDSVTFAPQETSKEVQIPLLDDAYVEGRETFSLRLRVVAEGTTAVAHGTLSSARLTITDNDTAGAATLS